jgi:hypothetical protein
VHAASRPGLVVGVVQVKHHIKEEFAYQSSVELGDDSFELVRVVPRPATTSWVLCRTRSVRVHALQVRILPAAQVITRRARQNMVQRLNAYSRDQRQLFSQVLELLSRDFVHILQRQVRFKWVATDVVSCCVVAMAHVVDTVVVDDDDDIVVVAAACCCCCCCCCCWWWWRQSLTGRAIIRSSSSLFKQRSAIDMALDVLSERGYCSVASRVAVLRVCAPLTTVAAGGHRVCSQVLRDSGGAEGPCSAHAAAPKSRYRRAAPLCAIVAAHPSTACCLLQTRACRKSCAASTSRGCSRFSSLALSSAAIPSNGAT